MFALQRTNARIVVGILAVVAIVGATFTATSSAEAAPATVTQDFVYTGGMQSFTVPSGVTQLTLSAIGAEGGRGGLDGANVQQGGYKGVVSGTFAVTPGQVLSISVGGGGAQGTDRTNAQNRPNGGISPLAGYAGGKGGMPGTQGNSGAGGGGGAATVITTGGDTIVAGGSGGGGGSGQWTPPLDGRRPEASHSPNATVTGTGANGNDVQAICSGACDGGGAGAGGGGARGGAGGLVEFGTGTFTEWLGYGGYPGSNSTAGLATLGASYSYYSGNSGNGSVSISYSTGSPDAPTAVLGTAGNGAVDLIWSAPTNTGGATITDYVVQYAASGSSPSWSTFADGTSSDVFATITGLTNGVAYLFRVAAVNSFGTSANSAASDPVSPSGVPGAPVLAAITPQDAKLSVAFTAASSGAPILRYEYQLDGGTWTVASGTASPVVIDGLTNGTAYAVALRAVSAIGTGAASEPLSGTPLATPGAPVIESAEVGIGSATIEVSSGFAGGGTITGYQVRVDSGSWADAGSTSPITVTGLGNGATVAIQVRAVNSSGPGAPSGSVVVQTPDVPSAPTITTVTAGDRSLTLAFAAGGDNGSAILDYEVQVGGGVWVPVGTVTSPVHVTGLTNGDLTQVSIRAVNAVGAGTASPFANGTPATTPGAPAIVGSTVSGSDATLDAYFTAPGVDGGSPILRYEYSTDGGATWRDRATGMTSSPLVITSLSSDGVSPLENGTEYLVEVRAVNAMGAGTASGVAPGIARSVPSAPTIDDVVVGDGTLSVAFTPGSNGGAPVLRYEYRLGSGTWTDTGSLGGAITITGLSNGTAYGIELRAVNSQGDGAASAPVSATPRSLAGVPVIGTVTPTDAQLTLAVSVADTGGSPVTGWQYTTDGGTTWHASPGAASPVVITALSSDGTTQIVNGESYPVAVRAVTDAGAGTASAVRWLSPRAVPAEPVIVVTGQDGALSVAFSVADDGGSPITRIEYSLDGGTYTSTGSLASPFVIGGLANGTSYALEVRAVNAAGASAESTPRSGTPRTAPGAPSAVVAGSGDSRAEVNWTAPADNGGSAITGYVATAWATASSTTPIATCSTSGALSCAITGLTNTTTYYVSVAAANAAGSSAASAPRVAVVPLAKPGAPTLTGLTPANTYLTVAFTAGTAGSRTITSYEYRLNGGTWVAASGTSSPITISGLTNGTSYSVEVRAISSAGVGAGSNTLTATPFALPNTPDSATIVAEPASGQATVTWTAPNANGSAITSYTVVAWNALTLGSQMRTCSPSPVSVTSCTITGLTNGTTYYITIDATNAAGTSTRSTPRVPVVFNGQPGMPSNVVGVAGDGSVALTWDAGATGSSAITDYTVWYQATGASGYTQFADGTSTTRTTTVTGLANGTAYTFQVRAVNSNGTGNPSAASSAVIPVGPGIVPALGTPTRTADGFTFEIANYSAETTYTFSATSGGSVSRSGSTVTVSGLPATQASTVTVTAQRAGYTTVSADVSGAALATGEAPVLSTPSALPGSFTVQIDNLDVSATYVLTVPSALTAVLDGDVVTVSGLADGASAELVVTATRDGYTDASGSVTGASRPSAGAPTLGTPVRTADGGTIAATLPSGVTTTYSVDSGATVSFDGATFTITGLAPGIAATLTVTDSRPGYVDASSSATVVALAAGAAPALSSATSTVDGFSFSIADFDGGLGYLLASTAGSVSMSGSTVTVSGLAPEESATVTVTAVLAGSTDASSSILSSALATGIVDVSGGMRASLDGFSFEIANYSVDATYTITTTAGTVTFTGPAVTVTGLVEGESATVAIEAVKAGETDAVINVTGTALVTGTAPSLSSASPRDRGFSFTISDYDPSANYELDPIGGGSVTRSGGVVTVTGLAPGASSEVRVTVSRVGATDAAASVTGAASPSAPPRAAAAAPPVAAPAAPAPDHAPAAPGSGGAMIGGSQVPVRVSSAPGGGSVTAGGITVTVSGPGGSGKVSGSVITARQGDELAVAITGFQPGSPAEMWAHSTPTLLSTVMIGSDAAAHADFHLPKDIELGEHVLVVKGLDESGELVTLSLGFLVIGDDAWAGAIADHAKQAEAIARTRALTVEGIALVGWIFAAAILLAGFILVLLWLRRRRERTEAAEG